MIHFTLKHPVSVPPYDRASEKSFAADEIEIKLGPEETSNVLTISADEHWVSVWFNGDVRLQARLEQV